MSALVFILSSHVIGYLSVESRLEIIPLQELRALRWWKSEPFLMTWCVCPASLAGSLLRYLLLSVANLTVQRWFVLQWTEHSLL